MEIEPIRGWLTGPHLQAWYRYLTTRYRWGPEAGLFLAPFEPGSVIARDAQLVFRAQLGELVGPEPPEPPEPSFPPPREGFERLEIEWPSDKRPPSQQIQVPTIKGVVRPWPPDLVLGSLVDLLT